MSEPNLELVRGVHERWARGNFASEAGVFSADFIWEQSAEAVEAGSRRGPEVGQSLRNLFEVYDDYRIEAKEFIDAGDHVVVPGRAMGVGKGSGMRLDQHFVFVWTVEGGLLSRLCVFTDRDEAFEAAGLSKQ